MGRYPPLYYLIVGLPSLVFSSTFGMHLMRLVSALLSALFLATALDAAAAARRRPLLVWGVAAATTPMAMWLSATVNPSGLEIASAICLWTSGSVLVLGEGGERLGRPLARAAVSATVLVQMRGLSLLWLAMILALLLACCPRDRLRAIATERAAPAWGALVGTSCVFAIWWLARYDPLAVLALDVPPHGTSGWSIAGTAFGETNWLLHQMVGLLGSGDTPAPPVTFWGWLALVVVLAVLGCRRGPRRAVCSLAGLVAFVVLVPVAIETAEAGTVGFIWQGRYTLPLAVGVPILAAAMGSRSDGRLRVRRSSSLMLATVIVLAQASMFAVTLRRYTVGLSRDASLLGGGWQPPFTTFLLFFAFLALVALYGGWLYLCSLCPCSETSPRALPRPWTPASRLEETAEDLP